MKYCNTARFYAYRFNSPRSKHPAENEKKKIYMIQFHPEVEHTEYGKQILQNFLASATHAQRTRS